MLSSFDKPTFEAFFDAHAIIKYIRINKVTIVGIIRNETRNRSKSKATKRKEQKPSQKVSIITDILQRKQIGLVDYVA